MEGVARKLPRGLPQIALYPLRHHPLIGCSVADGYHAFLPVVAVHLHPFYRGRAEVAGCDSFLEKPCSPTRLLQELARYLAEIR